MRKPQRGRTLVRGELHNSRYLRALLGAARSGTLSIVGNGAVLNSVSPERYGCARSGRFAQLDFVEFLPTKTQPRQSGGPQIFHAQHTGSAILNITSILASGDYARITTCGSTLAVGANCTISVTSRRTVTGR